MRRDRLGTFRRPAGDQRSRALQDIDNVRIVLVDLHDTGFVPMAGMYHVIPGRMHHGLVLAEEDRPLGECCCDSGTLDVGDWKRDLAVRHAHHVHRFQGLGSRDRQFFILLRARRAAYADRAHNLSFPFNWDAALERREIIERDHRRPALVHDVLKDLRRFLEQRSRPGLANGNVGTCCEGVVHSLKGHQISSVIDHGNYAAWRILLLGLGHRSRDDLFRSLDRERSLIDYRFGPSRQRSHQQQRKRTGTDNNCLSGFHDRSPLFPGMEPSAFSNQLSASGGGS